MAAVDFSQNMRRFLFTWMARFYIHWSSSFKRKISFFRILLYGNRNQILHTFASESWPRLDCHNRKRWLFPYFRSVTFGKSFPNLDVQHWSWLSTLSWDLCHRTEKKKLINKCNNVQGPKRGPFYQIPHSRVQVQIGVSHCLGSLTWIKKSSLSRDHISDQIYAKTDWNL